MLKEINDALRNLPVPTPRPVGLYEPIDYVLNGGGKRLRPTLMLLAYRLYRDDIEKVLPAAVALETYHNSTLLHDDLMDNADVRHGIPTVHKKWNSNTAILSGDAMIIMSFRHLSEVKCDNQLQALQLLSRSMQEVCDGQQYDINFETKEFVTEEEYLEMIRLKTSVLLACATKMGALIAGASEEECNLLYRFGELIGLAFQLQDDYLDTYGDPKVFGKRIGGDIICAKKTYLVVATLKSSNKEEQKSFLEIMNSTTLTDEEKISEVKAIYDAKGIPSVVLSKIQTYYDEAQSILNSIPRDTTLLWNYVQTMLGRNK